MSFESRNAEWAGHPREFHQVHSRSGTSRVWQIQVVGNVVRTSWGQFGGKMQQVEETFGGVNEGKTNYKTPAQYALERAREMVRKKHWEGYREVGFVGGQVAMKNDGSIIFLDPVAEKKIDFDNLPLSLSFYKPDNTLSAALEKKLKAGQAWYTRKRNGMMKVLVKDSSGELHIYSRRMLRQHDDEQKSGYTWDDRFPHIIHAVEPLIPPNTILLGELVVEEEFEGQTRERFDLAQSYIKSLTPKALADMERTGLFPFFYCWDIAFWDGEDLVSAWPVEGRHRLMSDLASRYSRWYLDTRPPHIAFEPIHTVSFSSPEEATRYAKERDWEGFVVVDPKGVYGDKAYNFKGKPDRPGAFCGKLKPSYEDDFIAIWNPDEGFGERSTKGSRAGGIKSVGLYQYNSVGKLVFIANCNSGLTKEMLADLAHPAKWPRVWKVEYKGRRYISDGDDTNALDFPAYVETRTDKSPQECMNPKL